jgi:hypothetical protein
MSFPTECYKIGKSSPANPKKLALKKSFAKFGTDQIARREWIKRHVTTPKVETMAENLSIRTVSPLTPELVFPYIL